MTIGNPSLNSRTSTPLTPVGTPRSRPLSYWLRVVATHSVTLAALVADASVTVRKEAHDDAVREFADHVGPVLTTSEAIARWDAVHAGAVA